MEGEAWGFVVGAYRQPWLHAERYYCSSFVVDG